VEVPLVLLEGLSYQLEDTAFLLSQNDLVLILAFTRLAVDMLFWFFILEESILALQTTYFGRRLFNRGVSVELLLMEIRNPGVLHSCKLLHFVLIKSFSSVATFLLVNQLWHLSC
jgi:hypothetical protein